MQAFRFATCGEDSPSFLYPVPSKPSKLKGLSFGPLPARDNDQSLVLKSQFWLIENSPDLKRLFWKREEKTIEHFPSDRFGLPPMRRINELLESGQACQRLETIVIPGYHFDQQHFFSVLEKMMTLSVLNLRYTNFSLPSWEALSRVPRHLLTLTVLDIAGYVQMPSATVQYCMASLPRLQVLRATRLSDKIITEDGRPWVCLGLRELQLEFVLEAGRSSQAMVLSHICDLRKLEFWRSVDDHDVPSFKTLQLTLEGDLDQLKVLRRMRMTVLRDAWDAEQAKWALENWRDLVLVSSRNMKPRCVEMLLNSGVAALGYLPHE